MFRISTESTQEPTPAAEFLEQNNDTDLNQDQLEVSELNPNEFEEFMAMIELQMFLQELKEKQKELEQIEKLHQFMKDLMLFTLTMKSVKYEDSKEKILGCLTPILNGFDASYTESADKVKEDIKELRSIGRVTRTMFGESEEVQKFNHSLFSIYNKKAEIYAGSKANTNEKEVDNKVEEFEPRLSLSM
jgi:hypothetical protein